MRLSTLPKIFLTFFFLMALPASFAISHAGTVAMNDDDLQTVPYVDPARYIGRWYQQSRIVLPFETQDCVCAQQTLGIAGNGNISVYNSCNIVTPNGALREIRGEAINDEPGRNAKFTVDFGLPRKGAYWIIALDPDYRWAVVSDPKRSSLYILSKTPVLGSELYDIAVAEAARQTDVSKLKSTLQAGCNWPAILR